jgi:hypothetical protein
MEDIEKLERIADKLFRRWILQNCILVVNVELRLVKAGRPRLLFDTDTFSIQPIFLMI